MSRQNLMLLALCLTALSSCSTPQALPPALTPFPVPPANLMTPPRAYHCLKPQHCLPPTSATATPNS